MEDKTDKLTRTYSVDKIDDILCEVDDSKIRINALMDYNLKLRRLNNDQPNKNLLAHEYERLSPIMELLNTDIFESLDRISDILSVKSDKVTKLKK